MKTVMISIKPEWVEKILNGEKTIEIRKTTPKCKLPCKVYIYCTKSKPNLCDRRNADIKLADFEFVNNLDSGDILLNGKVVAEFTFCQTIQFDIDGLKFYDMLDVFLEQSCLTQEQLTKYLGDNLGYVWQIDDLKIYDRPKELSEFKVYDKTYDNVGAFGWAFDEKEKYHPLTKAPQSWCYVRELEAV